MPIRPIPTLRHLPGPSCIITPLGSEYQAVAPDNAHAHCAVGVIIPDGEWTTHGTVIARARCPSHGLYRYTLYHTVGPIEEIALICRPWLGTNRMA